MRYLLFIFTFFSQTLSAQLPEKLTQHINFLSDDRLEGRRTGSNGEKLAYEYIIKQFKSAGLTGFNSENYLQSFDVGEVKELGNKNQLIINKRKLKPGFDFFPLPYSANGTFNLKEYVIDTLNLTEIIEENKTNPHFDIPTAINNRIANTTNRKKTVLIIYNSNKSDQISFEEKDKTVPALIPIIYLKDQKNVNEILSAKSKVSLSVDIQSKKMTGHNVIGYINNNAPYTIVFGAHYDHLGYGEDKNSLYSGKEKLVHNGADDNASGTAALIELARLIKQSALKNNNFLFVAFSGEELGLYGSKKFIEEQLSNTGNINFMINMDMVGRLNDSTRGLTIGGFGTSPVWSNLLVPNPAFNIKYDSSGSGPSDHTSFYRKDIPVLFFFTGTHMDYHKPTDDAEKINISGVTAIVNYIYKLIEKADVTGKVAFLKTREASTAGRSTFKVSLGIMPDYTYSGSGVYVDGVTENRAATKAGIMKGDVLLQLGDHPFTDVQTYMGALNKFNKGDKTKVKVKRGNSNLWFDVTF